METQGHHPLGRPRVGHRQGAAARAAGGVRARRAGARHLLRHADHGAAARRQGAAQQSSRVRLRRSHRHRAQQTARRPVRPPGRAGPRGARRVDEPRRSRRGAAAGFHRRGAERQRAAGRHGRRVAPLLRRAVPSRSHAHAAGQAAARALRARDLRLRAAVERRQHHRRRHRARARAGGQGQGAARSLGRRRFLGGRGAAAQGHRRSADLRVRRSRPHAPQRRRPGHEDLRRQPRREGHPRRCRSALPRRAARRDRPREEAQDHRRPVREGVRRRGARSSRKSTGWRRALSTPTSSSPRAPRPARRTSSSRTTTWAACRPTCA